jgi:hypothetical protein
MKKASCWKLLWRLSGSSILIAKEIPAITVMGQHPLLFVALKNVSAVFQVQQVAWNQLFGLLEISNLQPRWQHRTESRIAQTSSLFSQLKELREP